MTMTAYRASFIKPALLAGICVFAIFTISRIGLAAWQWDRVKAAGSVSSLFLGGLRIDLSTSCYAMFLPLCLALFLTFFPRSPFLRKTICFAVCAEIGLAAFMEAIGVPFIAEYDLRPNVLFIEYLKYPGEVFSMIAAGFKTEAAAVGIIAFIAVLAAKKLACAATQAIPDDMSIKNRAAASVIILVTAVFAVIGARGSLDHRPINLATVAYSTDKLANDLAGNSVYNAAQAAKSYLSKTDAFDLYETIPEKEIAALVRSDIEAEKIEAQNYGPTWAKHQATGTSEKNIVIVLLESHGSRFAKSFGGDDLSPNLDKIASKGWAFRNLYASGVRSARGIEAVTSGFPPSPSQAVIKTDKGQHDFFTIADALKTRGYLTQFIYGGESYFDGMRSYMLGNGWTDIIDRKDFDNPKFAGSWGASDEDLFEKAHGAFLKMHADGKKFFSLVFTVSNHVPYEYPDGLIEPIGEKASMENAVRYADAALGKFFEKAMAAPYFKDTVFLVIADHDMRTVGSDSIPVARFKIPGIILGGGIDAKNDFRLASQLDMPQTLLSIAGVGTVNPMIGHDLTRDIGHEHLRALMQRDRTFAYMNAEGDVIVIDPESKPQTYFFDADKGTLSEKEASEDTVKKAQAYSLLSSLMLNKGYYASKPDYSIE